MENEKKRFSPKDWFLKLDYKFKVLVLIIFFLLLIDICVVCLQIISSKYSYSGLCFENKSYAEYKLKAINSNASKSRIKDGFAYFKFSDGQRKGLSEMHKNFSVGIKARIYVKNYQKLQYELVNESEKLFYYGFLYESDFNKKGKLNFENNKSSLCGTDLRNFIKQGKGYSVFEISMALDKNIEEKNIPVGVYVYSSSFVKIADFTVEKAKLGFDKSTNVPYFGMASNGGNFNVNNSYVDFSGAVSIFPVTNSSEAIMPKVLVGFEKTENYGTSENQLKVKGNFGGEVLNLRRSKDTDDITIQTSTLQNPFSSYEFKDNSSLITKVLMSENSKDLLPYAVNKVFKAMKTDPGLILDAKTSNWRAKDYEVYEWDRFPGSLFFDTLDYDVQGKFFTRLAFFAEKTGYRGRILTDEEIGNMHGYNAHDYSADTLAKFFNAAFKTPEVLNEKELLLLDIVIQNGLIHREGNEFVADSGAVISISRESASWLRQNFIAHEAWHGIFFTNEDFRNTVAAVYYTIDDTSLQFMKGYWASQSGLGYDQNDEYLMHNEFMAYIMQQKLYGKNGVADYFVHCANRGSVIKAIPDLCAWVRRNGGKTFEDAGKVLDEYAFDRWGLACGRVALVTP